MKKAYEVHDKESLRLFILNKAEDGVPDDEKLELCYKGIKDDLE